jgi:hypothetical protein
LFFFSVQIHVQILGYKLQTVALELNGKVENKQKPTYPKKKKKPNNKNTNRQRTAEFIEN